MEGKTEAKFHTPVKVKEGWVKCLRDQLSAPSMHVLDFRHVVPVNQRLTVNPLTPVNQLNATGWKIEAKFWTF